MVVRHTGVMEDARLHGFDLDAIIAALREAGASFAFLFGSRVTGRPRPDSDLDIAAWFRGDVEPWTIPLPSGVDLVALNTLPLNVAGRVAVEGRLLFDDDPPARVRWQAETRLRYFDEAPRRAAFTKDALEAATRG